MISEENHHQTAALLAPLLIRAILFIGREPSFPGRYAKKFLVAVSLLDRRGGSCEFENQGAFVVQLEFLAG